MKKVIRKILLNPGPATTTDTVKNAMVVEDICPREEDFGEIINQIQNDLLKIINGKKTHHCVLFTASGTGALEATITCAVPKGKKLLVIENGAYGNRMKKIATTFGIGLTTYKISYGDYPNVNDIEKILQSDSSITHIAVVHHETTTGMLNPVDKICELANLYKKEVIVDAMSSYAGIPIDINQWNAGYLVSSSNKCIQGMPGLSFVIFKQKLLDDLKNQNNSFYFNIYNQFIGFEKTRQMPFTPPVQVCYALKKAIEEYFVEGGVNRWNRYQKNWKILYQGILALGLEPLLPIEQQSKILLAIKEPSKTNYNFNAMHHYLYEKGFTIYPGKGAKESTFRLSILGDLYESDIYSFLESMNKYFKMI